MSLPDQSAFAHEWATLQNNHEQYEKTCLLIKLSVVAVFIASLALSVHVVVALLLMLLLWLQEAIVRTGQSRLGERILRIEQLIAAGASAPGYQLHSEWNAMRPGPAGLLAEYGKNLLRPTVAFPYIALILMTLTLFTLP